MNAVAKQQTNSREDWLIAAIAELRPLFLQRGYKLPERIRVSVGFPGGGKRPGRRYLTQCWVSINGKDGAYDLFVSPLIDDEVKVLGALTHDLVHAAVGIKSGHRAPFQQCAAAMGLIPPWVSTSENNAFKLGVAKPVLAALGMRYPHAKSSMVDVNSAAKKQPTRMIKCSCPTCGYTLRTTMKWILTSGAPVCPTPACNMEKMEFEA